MNLSKEKFKKLYKEKYRKNLQYKENRDDNSRIVENLFHPASFKLGKFSRARNTETETRLFWLEEYKKYKYNASDDEKSGENVREAHKKNYREEKGLYAKLQKFQRE